ncbi:MAG: glycosyltransferase family 4 protein [Gammaproteobacteria bacterium]|nr:glycosyltransferase family 4 protein [Gammaproteobacteria bacterium]
MSLAEKKNILLVVRWPISGIRNYLRYVFNSKEFDAYHFTIVAPDLDFFSFFDKELKSSRFSFIPSKNSTLSLTLLVTRLILTRRFDLVNAHGFSSAIASLPMATIKKIPTLLTVHDVFTAAQFETSNIKIKRWLLTRVFSMANEIMTVSEDAKDNLIEYLPKINRKGLFANLNGINSQYFFDATPADLVQLFPETKGMFRIGFLGRFMSQKGFIYLIEAIEQIKKENPELNPVVICFGSGGFIREDKALIEQKDILDRFIFVPYTDDVAASMKGLDLVAMPSLWEACGLLAMEVLCTGTPLVATNCIGLREVLKDTPAIQVNPKDSKALSQAIKQQIKQNDKTIFKEYAPIATQRYNVSNHASVLAEAYSRLLIE